MAERKKIFITGIAGFLGFHLAQFLQQKGDEVSGCDNFNSYYSTALKRQRAQILTEKKIPILEADICNRPLLEKAILDWEPTHLVHLAAQAGVRHSLKHPDDYTHSNLEGFVKVMEVCRLRPQMKCLFASSSSVYGLNKKIPFAESDPTDQPASLYGATKKANEVIALSYHHLYGIPITGLRFFTVYGPWGRPDMAYYSFTKAIAEGKPIQIYEQGKLERDFTYIDDVIQGIVAAIDLGASYEIFNLGNNHPESVLTLISTIEELLGKKAVRKFLPMQPGDVPITYADIAKSQKLLGYAPKTSLQEGMRSFVKWWLGNKI